MGPVACAPAVALAASAFVARECRPGTTEHIQYTQCTQSENVQRITAQAKTPAEMSTEMDTEKLMIPGSGC